MVYSDETKFLWLGRMLSMVTSLYFLLFLYVLLSDFTSIRHHFSPIMFYGSLAAAFNNIVLIGFACSTLCYIQSAQYECERVTGHESVTLSGYYKIVSRFCSIGCFLILPETAAAIQLSLLIWHGGMFAYYYPMIVAYIFGFGLVPILVVGIGYFVCLRCNTKLVTAQPLSPSPQPPVEHLVITPPFPLSPRYVSFPPEFSDDASLMP